MIFDTDQPQAQANYIDVNESLTQENRRLLKESRLKSKEKNIKTNTTLIMIKFAPVRLTSVK